MLFIQNAKVYTGTGKVIEGTTFINGGNFTLSGTILEDQDDVKTVSFDNRNYL